MHQKGNFYKMLLCPTTILHNVQLMELEEVVSLDCCRLVKYDEFHEYLERSYEGEEDTPMGLLLGGVKSSYMFDLLLETRRPEQVFQPYKPGGEYPAAKSDILVRNVLK